jgi:rubredoxin
MPHRPEQRRCPECWSVRPWSEFRRAPGRTQREGQPQRRTCPVCGFMGRQSEFPIVERPRGEAGEAL